MEEREGCIIAVGGMDASGVGNSIMDLAQHSGHILPLSAVGIPLSQHSTQTISCASTNHYYRLTIMPQYHR